MNFISYILRDYYLLCIIVKRVILTETKRVNIKIATYKIVQCVGFLFGNKISNYKTFVKSWYWKRIPTMRFYLYVSKSFCSIIKESI